MESTQALTNELTTYNDVGALQIRNGLSPEALSHLRRRHALFTTLGRVIGKEISELPDVQKNRGSSPGVVLLPLPPKRVSLDTIP